ncbi:MAG: copper oxidase [Phycisphaerales bacterium]|nr:copper oxidase [Phycisphaerales bacterium]
MPTDNTRDDQAMKPQPTLTRRDVLSASALAGGALLLAGRQSASAAQPPTHADHGAPSAPAPPRAKGSAHEAPGEPGKDYTPVVVPNGWTLPYTLVDGWKVFHMVAEEVEHEFAPNLKATCWGYNGSVHGPVLELVEGDRVRIFVTNRLSALTTVHWHGVLLESGMDGVGGLSQKAIAPGETYMYEFTLRQHGTLMYHAHHDEMTQMGLGMTGMIVVHPRSPEGPRPDRDFVLMLHEWSINVGASRPDPNEMMEFNTLTMNAKCFPGTQPLIVKKGDRVRIRIGNLSAMNHHPIHLHGYFFTVTETDGGVIPQAGRWPETTVLVPVGSTRTVEFVADYPGDWAMHCHMTHHVMNQMGHGVPNMIGVDASGLDSKVRKLLPDYMTMGQHGMGGMTEMGMAVPPNSIPMVGGMGPYDEITMGGMFTILKVRDGLANYDTDPGWYAPPEGTLSLPATEESLKRNKIAGDASSAPRAPAAAVKSWELAKPDSHGRAPEHQMPPVHGAGHSAP